MKFEFILVNIEGKCSLDMNYEDRILISLADQSSRVGLFDALALEQLVASGYDAEAMSVEGPYQPIFDELDIGFSIPIEATVEGTWCPVGGVEQVEARFHLSGIGDREVVQVDAFWRGSIVARTVSAFGRVTEVRNSWTQLSSIDAEIEAELGSLPTTTATLEQERRSRLLTRVKANLDQPDLFTDQSLDQWLDNVGATSVSNLLTEFQGTVNHGGVQVTFSPPDTAPASPQRLPLAAALLIRNQGFSLTQLLRESKILRQQLDSLGLEKSPDLNLKLRQPLLVVWIIPVSVFDDPDWPGGSEDMETAALRDARRTVAGQWLAREGIGLVATPSPLPT